MRSILLLLLILMAGCGQSDQSIWIEVGEDYQSVQAKLSAIEAESLQGRVGVLCYPDRCEFYNLHDGTGLEITVHKAIDGTESLSSITLGEAGKGYVDKVVWGKQKKRVFERYNLRLDLQSNLLRTGED